jgi:hypothetical protein
MCEHCVAGLARVTECWGMGHVFYGAGPCVEGVLESWG